MAQWVQVLTVQAAVLIWSLDAVVGEVKSLAVGVWPVAGLRTLWLSFDKGWGLYQSAIGQS